jgi:GNAT superfamily N-acetyltransferase
MNIRQSGVNDLDALMSLFAQARGTIAALGIDQWQDGYPSEAVIMRDIEKGQSYCVEIDGQICATFALIDDGEPTYDRIFDGAWLTGDAKGHYLAIHRVAIAVAMRGQGIAPAILSYAADAALRLGRTSLRIDTHRGNVVMRRMLEKNGFTLCGVIYIASGAERVAYEKTLDRQ